MSSTSKAPRSRRTSGVSASGQRGTQIIGSASAAISPAEEQAIRDRAYYIYLERNGGPGDALSDWYQAEREFGRSGR